MIDIIFVLGGPGSGKGTLCQGLNQDGWKHMSLGELLRETAKTNQVVANLLEGGNMVPSDLAVGTIHKYLNQLDDNSKVLVDGFPRNETNWEEWLKQTPKDNRLDIKWVIFLETSREVMFNRIMRRALNSSRSDDREEVFENRYQLYLESLKVLERDELKNILYKIDSNGTPNETLEQVQKVITEFF